MHILHKSIRSALVFVLFISSGYSADRVKQVDTPEGCLERITELTKKTYAEAGAGSANVDEEVLKKDKIQIAETCLGAFSVKTVTENQLPSLSELYFIAGETDEALKAVGRYEKSSEATSSEKADLLKKSIASLLWSDATKDDPKKAEKLLKRLDRLGKTIVRRRIDARFALIEYYLKNSRDKEAIGHQKSVARLSDLLTSDLRTAALSEAILRIDGIGSQLSQSYGVARGLTVIETISPDLIKAAKAEQWVSLILSKYRLVGDPAPRIYPESVFNAADDPDIGVIQKGQITVMFFAAHWCGPCRPIYPAMLEANDQFKDKGVRFLLVTQLSNPNYGPEVLKPETELALIEKFYVSEIKIPFPILVEGINDPTLVPGTVSDDATMTARQWSLFSVYPMTLVIDKDGITRSWISGGSGHGTKVKAKIEELLNK